MLDRRKMLISVSGALAAPVVAMSAQAAQAQTPDVRVSNVRFDSDGVTLAGGLYMPADAPRGAFVLVQGGGPTPRIDGLARFLARTGFAVLAYDKRGTGESGGVYENANDVASDNLAQLARDAAAAMHALRALPETANLKAGYWGASQAGWVVPLAIAQGARADFFVLWSGPVCTASEEMESGIGRGGNASNDATARAFVERVRAEGRDTDPRDALRGLSMPGLWVFGGRDTNIPVALSIERLQGLIDAGQSHFSYWLDSAAGHFDLQRSLPLVRATTQWMLERVAAG